MGYVYEVNAEYAEMARGKQRLCLEVAAEAVEKGAAAPEQLLRMLTVEVGHTESTVVYEENKLAVHHYEPDVRRHETPIFVVYALINRPYILDLQPDRSVVRRLLEAGFPVYVLDWGEPSRLDADLTLTDYVCRYLDNCVEAVCSHAEAPDLHLAGYCMGGTMAAMYAARNPVPVRTLSWLAMPYAFGGTAGILERWARHFDPDAAVDAMGNVSGDALAVEFSMMDPVEHYLGKYVRLYENIEDDEFVENFARMERWIWDGVDVAGETFREFVGDLYRENRLATGEFELDGEPVDCSRIDVPVLGIVGEYDHIVPPESSAPFVDDVNSDDTRLIEFSAGHVGISVSSSAHERLWPDVADWFATRSASSRDSEGRESGTRAERALVSEKRDANVASDRERAQQTVETVAQRAATQVAAGDTSQTAVRSIAGIGPTYADRLTDAGIESVADLRASDPLELADVADVPPSTARSWLERAIERS